MSNGLRVHQRSGRRTEESDSGSQRRDPLWPRRLVERALESELIGPLSPLEREIGIPFQLVELLGVQIGEIEPAVDALLEAVFFRNPLLDHRLNLSKLG